MNFLKVFKFFTKRSCLYGILFVMGFLLPSQVGSASMIFQDGSEINGEQIPVSLEKLSSLSEHPLSIHFFYSSGCYSCNEAREFLNGFEKKHKNIQINEYNFAYSKQNRELFTTYKKQFHTHNIGYPVIFIGNIGLKGSSDIIHHTETITKWYLDNPRYAPGLS